MSAMASGFSQEAGFLSGATFFVAKSKEAVEDDCFLRLRRVQKRHPAPLRKLQLEIVLRLSFAPGEKSALVSHTNLIYNKNILRDHRSTRACRLDLPQPSDQLGDNSET